MRQTPHFKFPKKSRRTSSYSDHESLILPENNIRIYAAIDGWQVRGAWFIFSDNAKYGFKRKYVYSTYKRQADAIRFAKRFWKELIRKYGKNNIIWA